jgi:hypothetical protein
MPWPTAALGRMMSNLHPSVTFAEQTLRIVKYYEGHADCGGRGLLLVPCAFAWPDVLVRTTRPEPPSISYSPRGFGRVWEKSSSLGRQRAAEARSTDIRPTTTPLRRTDRWLGPNALRQPGPV